MLLSLLISLSLTATMFIGPETGDQLLVKYQALRTSLYNQRGFAPGDKETTRALRDEMSAWNATHDDFQVISAELQMSIWLEDTALCNALFERLSQLEPDNPKIAIAWGKFMTSQENADIEAIYTGLTERFPNSTEILLEFGRVLDSKNQYSRAILEIEKINAEDLRSPETALLYANLLYADNRFEESLAAINAIDSSSYTSNPAITARIDTTKTKSQEAKTLWDEENSIREVEEFADDLPLVTMQTSKGTIELELFEDHAPNTVANFISLADSGYYDGILFHRVIPRFMAQGGDPNSREGASGRAGEGGPGYTIKDEHTSEDYRNHFAGSLSMAKTSAPNSGGSQFFLTHLPTSHLNGKHTVFGRITDGLDNARALEKDDEIISVKVLRKRDHAYIPEKIGEKSDKVTPNLPPDRTPSLNSGTK